MQEWGRSHISTTLPVVSSIVLSLLAALAPASGQITPDATLGTERSVVTPNVTIRGIPSDRIDGGALKGANLFHSFGEFNILEGRGAYFTNPAGIENIFSRVTGTNPSTLLGRLGVLGNASLFLINPNGIIFGPNARLDVRGSFFASTASAFNFANGTLFSATNPSPPPLLTINVPIGLQYGGNAGSIQVQQSRLQVPDGKTLALVGGNVSLNGAGVEALGGRVELAGVGDASTIGMSVNGSELRLIFPDSVARADVSLTNDAFVEVLAGGGGSIAVHARNFDLLAGSSLLAGIAPRLGSPNAKAGDIEINATGEVRIDGNSGIVNQVFRGGEGNGGNVNITARSLKVTNGVQLGTGTDGKGDAGHVNINVGDTVSLDNTSGFLSLVAAGATGKGGTINLATGALSVTNGGFLNAFTFGNGDAGSITINARDTVSFDGEDNSGIGSRSASAVGATGVGKSGSVNITTGSLFVTNGAQLTASTRGQGDAGSVTINARDRVFFDGANSNGVSSGAFSQVLERAVGNGGNVNITAGLLKITNGAELGVSTGGRGNAGSVNILVRDHVSFDGVGSNGRSSGIGSTVGAKGIGNGGNINITASSLSVTNGALLSAETRGQGSAGNVNIRVGDRVSFDGVGSQGQPSAAVSFVQSTGVGNGGNITITTGSLAVTNSAQVIASTAGQGNAGNVTIDARDRVSFDGVSNDGFPSAAFINVEQGAVGNGGDLNITTGSLAVTNGAQLIASTAGQGNAGNVTIDARDRVSFDGASTSLFSDVEQGAIGNGGNINITTELLRVSNGAELLASSAGNGAAGNIAVVADSIRLDNHASLNADTIGGQGNINLHSVDLVLRHGSNITTNARGQEKIGGNITINTGVLVALENSDIAADSADFRGGNVNVTPQRIFGTAFRPTRTPNSDITASGKDSSLNGNVQINLVGIDPSQGLTNLPTEIADASNQITQNCPAAGGQIAENQFIVTGRGGLPDSPREMLSPDAVWTDWRTTTPQLAETHPSSVPATVPNLTTTVPLVEATGWAINHKGEVILTANNSTTSQPQHPWMNPAVCTTR
ncbi:MAG TPA: S-layer family protein [Waterburya sp.]